jgi:hypothetical protein
MSWVDPSEKDTDDGALGEFLWDSADHFRFNSGLKLQACFGPILGQIFPRTTAIRFTQIQNFRPVRDLPLHCMLS